MRIDDMNLDVRAPDRRRRTGGAQWSAGGRRGRLAAVVVLVPLVAVGLGGCGDAADDASSDTTTAVTASVGDGSSPTTAAFDAEAPADTTGGATTEPITVTASSPPGDEDTVGDDTDGAGSIDPSGQAAEAVLLLELDGVGYLDPATASVDHLPFGEPFEAVAAAVEPIFGPPDGDVERDDCPTRAARVLSYAEGLELVVVDGDLVGWSLGRNADPSLTTVGGIGIGSTLDQVRGVLTDVVVEETSLGTEVRAGIRDEDVEGALSGLLDGDGDAAAITTLWAGTACVAR
jgi:hypothetical protein